MKKVLFIAISLLAVLSVYLFLSKGKTSSFYQDSISLYRYDRSEFYRNSPDSPFLKQNVTFTYLDYFPINKAYLFEADFKPSEKNDTIVLATSSGTFEKHIVDGKATFNWGGRTNTLLVLGSDNSMFIPFMDKTSGTSSYGGGRYLDVQPPSGNKIVLDFNKSYNPYCAYTDGYTCPFPPKENRLVVAIEAGEKTYIDTK